MIIRFYSAIRNPQPAKLNADSLYEASNFCDHRAGHDTNGFDAGRARQNRSARWPTLR